MFGFNIGLSALRSSQVGMDVVAANIANANNPGYHRQIARHVDLPPVVINGQWRSTGTSISRINQVANQAIESALTSSVSGLAQAERSVQLAGQLELQFAGAGNSVQGRLENFFASLYNLQSEPHDAIQRQFVTESAVALAGEINSLRAGLDRFGESVRREIATEVTDINARIDALAEINRQIKRAEINGQQPNALLDRHQSLVNELAESIDVVAVREAHGFSYRFGSSNIQISLTSVDVAASYSDTGDVRFLLSGGVDLGLSGGRLAALEHTNNVQLESYRGQLDQFSQALIRQMDHVQATGVSRSGAFDYLNGHRLVRHAGVPLNDAGLDFPPVAGSLYINVHDTSSGARTQHRIDIDPATESLSDIAAKISSLDHIQAVIDPQDNQLSILAEPGYQFDFSGRLPDGPDRTGITGDAAIHFAGTWTGPENGTLEFRIDGSGQVGTDSPLFLSRVDGSGAVIERFNIGTGYAPGDSIELGNGVSIAIESGALADGDSFSMQGVADADTSGLLVGLGLNSFFEGSSAGDIQVSEAIVQNPDRIAAGRSGDEGDGTNVARMIEVQNAAALPNDRSITEGLDEIINRIAIEVHDSTQLYGDISILHENLLKERAAASGVDPNEEMVGLLQYQRSFQAATRIISTMDQTLAELMNIIR